MLTDALANLIDRQNLEPNALEAVLRAVMAGQCQDAEVAAFLTALRMKGETAGDLAVAVRVLRERMTRLATGDPEVLDTCGTGGDGKGTVNISTAAALVVAGCGVPVVKHGNRSVSSVCGSADVLAALGVKIDAEPAIAERCLHEAGLAFCFAPRFHPAMKHVADVRRRLGFRTIFNLLGPLLNPAGAKYQLIGVGRLDLLDTMAECLAQLGGTEAYLVHGSDGLDEVTLGGSTAVRRVQDSEVRKLEWTPGDFGLPECPCSELRVSSVQESAERIKAVLQGRQDPVANVVLANAAAALLAAGRVHSLVQGVSLARQAVDEGRARQVLDRLIEASNH